MLDFIRNVNRLGSRPTLPETLGMQWRVDQARFYGTPCGYMSVRTYLYALMYVRTRLYACTCIGMRTYLFAFGALGAFSNRAS